MDEAAKTLLIGPFSQLLSFTTTKLKGALSNDEIGIIENAGIILRRDKILKVGNFEALRQNHLGQEYLLKGSFVGLPGFIDAHTHLLFAGSRHLDYSDRNQGVSYLEIAHRGGGIWDTVQKTRDASSSDLKGFARSRIDKCLSTGVTTIEIKTGYGLGIEEELRMLTCISDLSKEVLPDLIPTCLAAHMKPKEFTGSNHAYLDFLARELLPEVKARGLAQRVDIFVEETAFGAEDARAYLQEAKDLGFDLTVHGDQFTCGGSALAVGLNALSVDHLEASGQLEIDLIASSATVATALPGASIGLACAFAPGRKLLDAGASLAIASDWNPGSAPMGDLLTQGAIFGAFEKLSDAEVLAAMTYRAARALNLKDRGRLKAGMLADLSAFEVADYREILYHQGQLKPSKVWKAGSLVKS